MVGEICNKYTVTQTKSDGVDLEQWLFGRFNHLEKHEAMGRIIPYIMENNKMLETINQMVNMAVAKVSNHWEPHMVGH